MVLLLVTVNFSLYYYSYNVNISKFRRRNMYTYLRAYLKGIYVELKEGNNIKTGQI